MMPQISTFANKSLCKRKENGMPIKSRHQHKRSIFNRKETLSVTSHHKSRFNQSCNDVNLQDDGVRFNKKESSKAYLKNLLQTKRMQLCKLAHSPSPLKQMEQGTFLLTNEYLKETSMGYDFSTG